MVNTSVKDVQLNKIAWMAGSLLLVFVLLYLVFQLPGMKALPLPASLLVCVGGLGFWLLAYLMVDRINILYQERRALREQVRHVEERAAESYRRLEAIFQVSQKYVEASDENEVVELVLKLAVDLVGATGASYVPLDEHGQPLTAISEGVLPFPVINDWVEYLAAPAVRDRCRTCEMHGTLNPDRTCPLLKGPFSDAIGLFCLPLRRGEREFGVLNLFMPNIDRLDEQSQAFLNALIDETALALEGVRLRRRELAALRQLQAVREKKDFSTLLGGLLEDVRDTVEADYALLLLTSPGGQPVHYSAGQLPAQAQPFLDGILQGVLASKKPVLLGEVAGEAASGSEIRSLMAAPLLSAERHTLGVLLVGSHSVQPFQKRQLSVLQTVAGQVALLVENANGMAELEYKVMIEERTRLAREIHDGLAQTLGFLKLQTAQMQNYLSNNDLERLAQSARLCYTTLSEAYQDARQAIDGLRIWPGEDGLQGWLEQTVEDFQEISGLHVDLEAVELSCSLPPEVHAQLIRIVQEGLSNIRKHARASQVAITCHEVDGDLWLEVRDNGRGFSPEDVPVPSQHGLRGMRERAELIGADFQVISLPLDGTTVRVRLPLHGLKQPASDDIKTEE